MARASSSFLSLLLVRLVEFAVRQQALVTGVELRRLEVKPPEGDALSAKLPKLRAGAGAVRGLDLPGHGLAVAAARRAERSEEPAEALFALVC